MLYEEERKMKIIEYIQEYSRASVQQLAKEFNVSESTIRRDLKELEDTRLLKRTHGGAVCLESVNFEPTFIEKGDKFAREKESIAIKAAEFIQEGDTILLDAGTTTQFLAKEIKKFSRLTVVTNSLSIAQELQGVSGIEIVVTGGMLRQSTLSLVGPIAEESFKMLRVDKAFIATNGLDLKEGLSTPNIIEAATKRKMMEVAKQVILLADHTKIGRVSFAKFGDVAGIDKFIVDQGIQEEFVRELENRGIAVHVVNA